MGSITKTAAYLFDIIGSHFVDIKSSFPTKRIAAGLNRNDILARIELDVSKENIVSFKQPVDSNTIIVKRLDLEQLEFQILNDGVTLFKIDPNQKICLNLFIKPYP